MNLGPKRHLHCDGVGQGVPLRVSGSMPAWLLRSIWLRGSESAVA